jgi:hypothetical protein
MDFTKINEGQAYIRSEVDAHTRGHEDINETKQWVIRDIAGMGNEIREAMYDEDFPIAYDFTRVLITLFSYCARRGYTIDFDKLEGRYVFDDDHLLVINDLIHTLSDRDFEDSFIPFVAKGIMELFDRVNSVGTRDIDLGYYLDEELQRFGWSGTMVWHGRVRRPMKDGHSS